MPDLAVIMSIYEKDRFEFVRESVESILNQTFPVFHYFIVFDGTVSWEIEDYFNSHNDARLRLYRLEQNGGLASALNYLLEVVLKNPEYKYIARMDADDISLPARFLKQRNYLKEKRDIACVGCWYQEIDESGNYLANRKLPDTHEALKKRYFWRAPFAHPSVMYRRSLIETVGKYPTDTDLIEDNVFWGKALKQGFKFGNIPELLLRYRIDNKFYKRRSGIKYGWNYIIARFKINKSNNFPIYTYFITLLVGVIKMMPHFILRSIYVYVRKY